MPEVVETIEIRNIATHGASLALNIPAEMAKKMGLSQGCPVVFRFNESENRIIIEKIQKVQTHDGTVIEINELARC